METFDARQLACIASPTKTIWWKFHIVDNLSNNYYWSIQDVPDLVQAYTFNIINFSGVTLRRNKSESGIHAPNDVTFSIINAENTYTAANFKDGTVSISLVIDDGIGEETCGTWVFDIKSASPYNQQIDIVCTDFLQKYLKGSYPNTRNISDIFPSTDATPDDALCIPEIYGTAYIPLRSVYADGARYYILGDTTKTYTISEVRMPIELGKQKWEAPAYDFPQATKADADLTDWRMFQAMIAGGAAGIFLSGTSILDMPTKLSTSDTASMTSPADIIEQVMLNMGVPSAYIDSAALTAAKAVYTSWGLEFNFAYYYKQDRTKVISQLLSMCHSYIEVGDKLRLKVLSKTPVKTITDSEVTKDDIDSPPNFSYSDTVSEMTSDSGYIAYNEAGELQNELIKIIVPAKSTTYTIDSEIFECPAVQDSQDVQRIGTLRLQRKFLKMGDVDAKLKGTCLALRPDDVITIDDANFGGTYNVLVDEIKISYDATVDISCLKFSEDLDDWTDLTPDAVTLAEADDPTSSYSIVISGPDTTTSSGTPPNTLPGRLKIGGASNYWVIDPAAPIRTALYVSSVECIREGNLNGFLGYDTDVYGWAGGTLTNYIKINATAGTIDISGAISGGTIDIGGADTTSFHVDADGNIWSGAAAYVNGVFKVSKEGKLYAVGAEISGNLISGSIHIPDQNTTAESFHVNSGGDAWWGCTENKWGTDPTNATAYISKAGSALFQSIMIGDGANGWTLTSNYLIPQGTGAIWTASSVPRLELDAVGLKAQSATGQTAEINTDGSGWFGLSGTKAIEWSKAGVVKVGGFYAGSYDLWGGNAAIGSATIVLGGLNGTSKIAIGPTADNLTLANVDTLKGFYADGVGNFRHGGPSAYGVFDATAGTYVFHGVTISSDVEVEVSGTTSDTWMINSDQDNVNTQLILGRTTGGNATIRWNGTNVTLDKQTIADNAILTVDHASAADNDYAKFTANGLEGRSYAEVKQDLDLEIGTDLVALSTFNAHKDRHDPNDGDDPLDTAAPSELASVQASAIGTSHSLARADHQHQIQHSIANNHIVTVDGTVADNQYAKWTASGLEGRSYAQVLGDLSGQATSAFSFNNQNLTNLGTGHDTFSDFVANEHINHTSVSISAGNGLTGGGDISANRTISLSHLGIQSLTDPGADRILFWDDSATATAWMTVSTGLQIDGTSLKTKDSEIVHDNLSGFVANEHINHTSVTLTAGDGLSGGGDISANRTFSVNVDDSTIEINTDTLRVKDKGITYAKIQDISATNRLLGRDSTGAGVVEEITPANVLAMLSGQAGATFSFNNQSLTGINDITVSGDIASNNFVSGLMGKGFRVTQDFSEFANISVRGTFRTVVFQKDVVSAIGGNLLVRPADLLDVDMTAADSNNYLLMETGDHILLESGDKLMMEEYSMKIKGDETFAVGDILHIKDVYDGGIGNEWLKVSYVEGSDVYGVVRDMAGHYTTGNNPAWTKGVAVVNYGPAGSGGIYMTASETYAPYMDIYTHNGDPWNGVITKVRLGNLAGITDTINGHAVSGYGLYSDNAFLKGGIVATYGSIGAWDITSTSIQTGAFDTSGTMYFGVDGISLSDTFKVTPAGVLTATGASISGTVTITSGTGYGNLTDIPTELSEINSTEGTKLTGIEPNATVGATWGTNLYSIPATLTAPSGDGLYLSSTYMGFYKSSAWTTYIDNSGNMVLGDVGGGYAGLSWNQTAATLSVRGAIYATSGTFSGAISAATIDIGGTAATSFHVDSDGNIWSGAAAFGDGVFKVSNTGVLTATEANISGTIKASAGYIGGTADGWAIGTALLSGGTGATYIALDQANSKIRIGAKTSLTDANTGVHLGSDGLAIGASSVFKVTSAGELTATNANISGAISSSTIDVGSGASSFHVDINGNIWSGAADFVDGVFSVSKDGELTATKATISGDYKTSSTVGTTKGIHLDVSKNELYFYGDRGDTTIEQLASIGIVGYGTDYAIIRVGSSDSTRYGIISRNKGGWPAILGRNSSYGQGVSGTSSSGEGVSGATTTGVGVNGTSGGTGNGIRGFSVSGYAIYSDGTTYLKDNTTIARDKWIGLGASAGRILFDNAPTNTITFSDCNVIIEDNLIVDGTNIGITADTDLIAMASGELTINGNLVTGTNIGISADTDLIAMASGELTINGNLVTGTNIGISADTDLIAMASGELTINGNLVTGTNIGISADKDLIAMASGELTINGGLITAGDLQVNGTNIGITADTDLIAMASGVLTVNGSTISTGSIFINETANTFMTTGLTINQGAADDEILALKSSDVSQPYITIAEADTYTTFKKYSSTLGGLSVRGFTESKIGVELCGYCYDADSATSISGIGSVIIDSVKHVSQGGPDFGADENIFCVKNANYTKFIVKGDGDTYQDGVDQGTYDDYDDALACRDMAYVMAGTDWSKKVWKYHEKELESMGVMKNGFVSNLKSKALLLSGIGELYGVLMCALDKLGMNYNDLRDEYRNI